MAFMLQADAVAELGAYSTVIRRRDISSVRFLRFPI